MNFAQLARSILIVMAAALPCWVVIRLIIGYLNNRRGSRPAWAREMFLTAFLMYLVIVAAMTIAPSASSLNSEPGFNIIPLKTLFTEAAGARKGPPEARTFFIENWGGNLLLLFPLGVFLPVLSRRFRSLGVVLLAGLAVSAFIESVQFLSQFVGSYRVADIDDVIVNTLGACTGFLAFKLGHRIFLRSTEALAGGEAA